MIYTTLVNKTNPIKESFYQKIHLVKAKNRDQEEVLVEEKTLEAFESLQEELKKEDIIVEIDSAFRSIEEQQRVKEEILQEKGEEYTKLYVAEPKYSEHHTGFVIDIHLVREEEEQEEVLEKKWLRIHELLPKYGFILRYPKGKETITGYNYECWHARYVGVFPARIMYENKLTLEEYLSSYGCVIAVNKPVGCTSFDIVNEISHLFGIKRVGHNGTLDPMATGVLLVAVGSATKIIELLTVKDKEYIAGVELGKETDTYDITGKVLEEKEVPDNLNIEETLKSFQKTYLQEVPIYSAVKVNGKKLYEYAREEKEIECPKKEVTIKEIELLENNNKTFTFRALVSKGCYIRSLIHDIGKELNTNATMTSLVRTKQGDFSIENTNTLEEIKNNQYKSYSIEEVLNYPIIVVEEELEVKIKNGVKLENNWNIQDKVIFKNKENKLLGIYEVENNQLRVWKNFQ